MPRGKVAPENYMHSKIYKLIVDGFDFCYIGSTTHSLMRRKWHHDFSARNPDTQNQTAACALYGYGEVEIQLVEDFPCANAQELAIRERWWIENTPNCINTNIPAQTWQERRAKRQDAHDAYMKEFRSQKYTCECGKTIARAEKARHERSAFHLRLYGPVATTQDSDS